MHNGPILACNLHLSAPNRADRCAAPPRNHLIRPPAPSPESDRTSRPPNRSRSHCDPYSPWCSNTGRTTLSRTSRGYGVPFIGMTPSSQELEPPPDPGRFTIAVIAVRANLAAPAERTLDFTSAPSGQRGRPTEAGANDCHSLGESRSKSHEEALELDGRRPLLTRVRLPISA
jgi:hypothetical protein